MAFDNIVQVHILNGLSHRVSVTDKCTKKLIILSNNGPFHSILVNLNATLQNLNTNFIT